MAENPRKPGRPRNAGSQPGTVKALDRALDVLALLATGPGLTLSDIAEATGQPVSSIHRILTTLAGHGMAECEAATQNWSVGPAAYGIGQAFLSRFDLADRARPVLDSLTEATRETASIAVPDRASVMYVAQTESGHMVRACLSPGMRAPLHATACGKALLCWGGEDYLTRYLDRALDEQGALPQISGATLTRPDTLREDLRRSQARGWTLDNEEMAQGMRCIAAPVFEISGQCIAAISVSGPAHRIGPEHSKTLGAAVTEAARALSASLGWRE